MLLGMRLSHRLLIARCSRPSPPLAYPASRARSGTTTNTASSTASSTSWPRPPRAPGEPWIFGPAKAIATTSLSTRRTYCVLTFPPPLRPRHALHATQLRRGTQEPVFDESSRQLEHLLAKPTTLSTGSLDCPWIRSGLSWYIAAGWQMEEVVSQIATTNRVLAKGPS